MIILTQNLLNSFVNVQIRVNKNLRKNKRKEKRLQIKVQNMSVDANTRTKVERNQNIAKLQAGYLFPEIAKKKRIHQEKNPDANIISLGVGDTTEPISIVIAEAMSKAAMRLSTREGYSGYGEEQGKRELRKKIVDRFYSGNDIIDDEIFVSDGAKCDISRLQMMFGTQKTVAIQNPSYPAYVDTSVIQNNTEHFDMNILGYKGIRYMPCTPENNFFPDLSKIDRSDLIFFCSPNNPIGTATTYDELVSLVEFAKKNGSIIIYDTAYALYIKDKNCPKTIYDIPNADEVAIEVNSFSKYAGFTGVRLGWTVVPNKLKYADGSSVRDDYNRIMVTCFNGASNIAQAGGLACLEDDGYDEMMRMVNFYSENAQILRETFNELGFSVYGGNNSPFIWISFPGKNSWDVFQEILEKCHIVTTPGIGFGSSGEGFVRVSAFSTRDNLIEAVERFKLMFTHTH